MGNYSGEANLDCGLWIVDFGLGNAECEYVILKELLATERSVAYRLQPKACSFDNRAAANAHASNHPPARRQAFDFIASITSPSPPFTQKANSQ
ncbi:hypothetical protein [Aeoliella mucimassa]|uniref:hypothetical protein n=1 Tax=Aeoliella mucimassa TaxID=2527972 RepID=UPI0018D2F01C|nr:hypothetical protein [Aeoliella mucimassa]